MFYVILLTEVVSLIIGGMDGKIGRGIVRSTIPDNNMIGVFFRLKLIQHKSNIFFIDIYL